MDCAGFERLSGRYADGEAPQAVIDAMREHALSCARCAGLLDELYTLGRMHSSLPVLELPEGLVDRIMSAVEEREDTGRKWIWRVLVSAAAAAFVAIGIWAGLHITQTLFGRTEVEHAEVTGLEYLENYPPDSVGEAIDLAAKGGGDE